MTVQGECVRSEGSEARYDALYDISGEPRTSSELRTVVESQWQAPYYLSFAIFLRSQHYSTVVLYGMHYLHTVPCQ